MSTSELIVEVSEKLDKERIPLREWPTDSPEAKALMSLLKRRPRLVLLAIWFTSLSAALALNGAGEIRSSPALMVTGATLVLLAVSGALIYGSPKLRLLVISSKEEYSRQRAQLLAIIVASAAIAIACFWNAAR